MISTTILLLVPLVITIMLMSFFAVNVQTKFYNKLIVVILMVLALSTSFVSFNALLSQPKPVKLEWLHRNVETIEILSAVIINEEAIYVWVLFPGENKPRYYVFDWNKNLAEQLQKAMRNKKRGVRGKIIMDKPFDDYIKSLFENNIIIFKPPTRQLPDKQYETRP